MRSGFTQTAYLCTIDCSPLLIPHSLLANDRLLWGRWESRKRPKRYRLFIWSQTLLCGDHHYNHIDRQLTVRRGLTHWLAGSTGKTNMKLCQKSTKLNTNTISKFNYKNNRSTKTTRSTIDRKIGLNKWPNGVYSQKRTKTNTNTNTIQIQIQTQTNYQCRYLVSTIDRTRRSDPLTEWDPLAKFPSSPPLYFLTLHLIFNNQTHQTWTAFCFCYASSSFIYQWDTLIKEFKVPIGRSYFFKWRFFCITDEET